MGVQTMQWKIIYQSKSVRNIVSSHFCFLKYCIIIIRWSLSAVWKNLKFLKARHKQFDAYQRIDDNSENALITDCSKFFELLPLLFSRINLTSRNFDNQTISGPLINSRSKSIVRCTCWHRLLSYVAYHFDFLISLQFMNLNSILNPEIFFIIS